jgi:GTP cyclohydrolase II
MENAFAPLKTIYGLSTLHCFSFGEHEDDNVLCLATEGYERTSIVRVQSACYTGEIFRSTDCDCHEQLDRSLRTIHDGGGLLVYMLSDGRGAGLLTKVRGLWLGVTQGMDTYDAYRELGVEPDPRRYERVSRVIRQLGLSRVRLLTNNPRKVEGLESEGLDVERLPLIVEPTTDSLPYLTTKQRKFGHLLDPGADPPSS